MRYSEPNPRKVALAEKIFSACMGTNGVWADPSRYRFQCWTRDFMLAILPLLLERKQYAIARKHLVELTNRIRPSGRVPILFLDKTLPFVYDKVLKSIKDRKLSFMLKRWMSGNLWNLTPGTRDSEIAYLIAVHMYDAASGDHSLMTKLLETKMPERIMSYIEHYIMVDGMARGCDWRDTMEKELVNTPLLTNNSLLYAAYHYAHRPQKAQWLKERINQHFWNGQSYQDAPNRKRFDPLGGALAVLHGVIPQERYKSITESFRSVDSPHGVTIKCKHNPFGPEEREVIDRTDGVVVWPFIVGFTVLALLKMGEVDFAKEQMAKLDALHGFREWYDPENGKGYGALEQLWSAVLYLRCVSAFEKEDKKHHV